MSTRTYPAFKRDYGVNYTLGVNADSKTVKGEKFGYLTGIQYLAPSTESGYQTCPMASDGCKLACLFTAGRASFDPKINRARITRTKLFFENRSVYMAQLRHEIGLLVSDAERKGLIPAVRLNGTSDLKWERIACGCGGHKSLMEHFPSVQFYDYTKIPLRYRRNLPDNYALTFSLSETNDADALEALQSGGNVAAVFRQMPVTWQQFPVIDGDGSDLRFNDGSGVIVGLKAKGAAKHDTSGFVR